MARRKYATPTRAVGSPVARIDVLTDAKIKVRMDGKGRWIEKRHLAPQ